MDWRLIMSLYMNGGTFLKHYKNKDIYEKGGNFYVVVPASYSCLATKEIAKNSIELCEEYIDSTIDFEEGMDY